MTEIDSGVDLNTLQVLHKAVQQMMTTYSTGMFPHSPGLAGDDPYMVALADVERVILQAIKTEDDALDAYFEKEAKERGWL